jgi:hypothetical protein
MCRDSVLSSQAVSHYVSQTDFELIVLLSQSEECLDYKHVPLHLAWDSFYFFSKFPEKIQCKTVYICQEI